MMNQIMKKLNHLLFAAVALMGVPDAYAWMELRAPDVKCEPAGIKKLSAHSTSNFVIATLKENHWVAKYSEGASIDLNADGFKDFVFIIPWMGCGLAALGYDAHFIVSDGKGGRMENVLEGYGMNLDDLVKINGNIYMRHSFWTGNFQNSQHNHWVFQIFSFGKDGVIRCANHEVGDMFPAVTIFYKNPKFKRVGLTEKDIKSVIEMTRERLRVHKCEVW